MIPREGWLGDLVRESKRIANIPVYPGIGVIATHSHLAPAMVFLRSLKKHHPSCKVYLLLADADESAIESTTIATAVRTMVGDVQVVSPYRVTTADLIEDGRSRYGATEWCCALKPALLRYILAQGHRNACYFDTDMRVYAPMSTVFRQLWTASILLSPHLHEPLPEDGFVPRDSTILRAGTFNGGFVGVRNCAEAHRFLDWWEARIMQYGVIDGLLNHGDQNWLNLVPALFPGHEIVRETEFNAAYWNLVDQQVDVHDGMPRVDARAITLFHYSGLVEAQVHNRLSKHETRQSPVRSRLAQIVDAYSQELEHARRDLAAVTSRQSGDTVAPVPQQRGLYRETERCCYKVRFSVSQVACEPGSSLLLEVVCEPAAKAQADRPGQATDGSLVLVCVAVLSEPSRQLRIECGRMKFLPSSDIPDDGRVRMAIRAPTWLGELRLSLAVACESSLIDWSAHDIESIPMRIGC